MKKLFLALAVLGLVACGDKSPASIGASVESSSTTTRDKSTAVGMDKKIDQSEKAAVSVKMAAPVLLSKAARQLCSEAGIKPPYRVKFLAASDKTLAGKVPPKLQNRTVIATIQAIAAAFEPAVGWRDGDGDEFMIRSDALITFVDAVSTEAVGKIGATALRDPGEAQQAIITSVASIPAETLEAIWAASVKEAKTRGRPSANLAGSNAPIEFKNGSHVVSIGPQGMWLIADGTTLFGEGKIGGKAIDVSLETSLSTGLGRKLTLDAKATSADSESVKVDAGIKH